MDPARPRLLITGGSGFVGRRLVSQARAHFEVAFTTYSRPLPGGQVLDLRDADATRALVRAWAPDVIVHTAGSDASANMEAVIVQGTANLCQAARAAGARLIFLSSDVIFDGERAPYAEDAVPRPLHAYGRAKVAAEQVVAGLPDHLIVRTSLIYSLEEIERNLAWLVDALAARRPVTLFTDQWRNPIWVQTLTWALIETAAAPVRGRLHVAGRQALNRHDFGLRLLDWFGIEGRETLRAGPGDRARWPADCRLDIARAERLLATPLLGVDEVLAVARGPAPPGQTL